MSITEQTVLDGIRDLTDLSLMVNGSADLNGTGSFASRSGTSLKTLARVLADQEVQENAAAADAVQTAEDRVFVDAAKQAVIASLSAANVNQWFNTFADLDAAKAASPDPSVLGAIADETKGDNIVLYLWRNAALVELHVFTSDVSTDAHLRALYKKIILYVRAGIPQGQNQIGCDVNVTTGPQVALTTMAQTVVTSNAEIAALPGVSGSGTYADPYVLANIEILGSGSLSSNSYGFHINIPNEVVYLVISGRIAGWSNGDIKICTAPGSRIWLEDYEINLDQNANVNDNRTLGVLNNTDLADPGGTIVFMKRVHGLAHTIGNGALGYAQGQNCELSLSDCRFEGGFFIAAQEKNISSAEDRGDRRVKARRVTYTDAFADGSNSAAFFASAPGVIVELAQIDVLSYASGRTELCLISARGDNNIRHPVRYKPRVLIEYCRGAATTQNFVDLEFFEPIEKNGAVLRYSEVTSSGTTRRAFQLGAGPGTNGDHDLHNIGGYGEYCLVNYTGNSGGAFAENFLSEAIGDFLWFGCVVICTGTGGDDAFEFYEGQLVHGVVDCLVLGTNGQAFDSFTNNDTRAPSGLALAIGLVGQCTDEAVQLTNVGSALVHDMLVSTGRSSDGVQNVQPAGVADNEKAAIMHYNRFAGNSCGPVYVTGDTPSSANLGFTDVSLAQRVAVVSEVSIDSGDPVGTAPTRAAYNHEGQLVFANLDATETTLATKA